MAEQTVTGRCFCGAVEFSVEGAPEAMGYCHCSSCRFWAGAPVNAFTLWKPGKVKVTRGDWNIGVFQKTERSRRKFCRQCGGHLMTEHPLWNIVDVFAAVIPELRFEPTVHVNYGETVMPMRDGLPKLKDFPKELGGSGETLPE
jgi:hypothetical protein